MAGGVFINKSLCLRRQIFVKFAKRSTVFIIAVETKHSIVDKFGLYPEEYSCEDFGQHNPRTLLPKQ